MEVPGPGTFGGFAAAFSARRAPGQCVLPDGETGRPGNQISSERPGRAATARPGLSFVSAALPFPARNREEEIPPHGHKPYERDLGFLYGMGQGCAILLCVAQLAASAGKGRKD